MMNLYPPLLGAGIRVKDVSPAHDRLGVEMKLTWWNANFARSQFGESLYMMISPRRRALDTAPRRIRTGGWT